MVRKVFITICATIFGINALSAAAPENGKGKMPNFKIAKTQLSTSPAAKFDQAAPGIRLFNIDDIRGGGVRIKDADAPEGTAISHAEKKTEAQRVDLHKRTFTFGIYEKTWKKMLQVGYVLKNRLPQDEKYHWYYMGNTVLYPQLVLWMHQNWGLSVELGKYYDAAAPDQEYKIYGLLKFQGPGYVKDSKQPGDIRLAQIALVPIKK